MASKGTFKWAIAGLSFFGLLFLIVLALASALTQTGTGGAGNTAHIKIRGVITTETASLFGEDVASSEELVGLIDKAENTQSIKAILLDINSPGGSAVASEELATAIKEAQKPVVALIRDVGASGAYWAASSADVVVASPLSITGSVGATSSYLEFSGLMRKYGVGYERIVSGEYKDTGAPYRELTAEEKALLQEMIELTGTHFAQNVKENRGLSEEVFNEISSGRIYLGQQAKELNLIDELGNREVAERHILDLAGLKEVTLVEYSIDRGLSFSEFLFQQASLVGRHMGQSMLYNLIGAQSQGMPAAAVERRLIG